MWRIVLILCAPLWVGGMTIVNETGVAPVSMIIGSVPNSVGGFDGQVMYGNGQVYSFSSGYKPNFQIDWVDYAGYLGGSNNAIEYESPGGGAVGVGMNVEVGYFGGTGVGGCSWTWMVLGPGQSVDCDGVYDSSGVAWIDDGLHNWKGVVGLFGGTAPECLVFETTSPFMVGISAFWYGVSFAIVLGALWMVRRGLTGSIDVG